MKIFKEILKSVLLSFNQKKARTLITALGPFIGIFVIIFFGSITNGIKKEINDRVKELGSETAFIRAKNPSKREEVGFSLKDVEDLKFKARHIEEASPNLNLSATFIYQKHFNQITLKGTDNDGLKFIPELELKAGRYFEKEEYQYAADVVVLGNYLAKSFFQNEEDAIGETVNINASDYKVIGVLDELLVNEFLEEENINYFALIPATTLLEENGLENIYEIKVKAVSKNSVSIMNEEINKILLNNHKENDFTVHSSEELFEEVNKQLRTFSIILYSIMLVAFFVGGTSIMNVMLVSVLERQKEIGIRKAIGAKEWHILFQFLLEGILLSLIGGLFGMFFGYSIILLIKRYTEFPVYTPFLLIFESISYVIILGLVFSFFPAYRASKKKVVDLIKTS